MHVVALAGWYPVKQNPYVGDFIQRHLHAISQICTVTLIYVDRSPNNVIKTVERNRSGNLNEIIFHLPEYKNKVRRVFQYCMLIHGELKKIQGTENVDLLHIHVVKSNGLFALVNKWLYSMPYVITEHSTEYINGKWEINSFFKKLAVTAIFRNALSVHCVSNYLAQQVSQKLKIRNEVVVIPNVVNTQVFHPIVYQNAMPVFLHVSTLTEQKNVVSTLQAFKLLKQENIDFILKIIGPASVPIDEIINQCGLEQYVVRLDEMPQPQLALQMATADVLILFSKYETFGCVVIEAMACGKPVLASDLPVLKELIHPYKNGSFAKNVDAETIADCLKDFLLNRNFFDAAKIREEVILRFSHPVIAQQFSIWFHSVLG